MAEPGNRETRAQRNKGGPAGVPAAAAAAAAGPDDCDQLARLLKLKPAELRALGRRAAMKGNIAGLRVTDALTLTRALLFNFGQSVGVDDLLEPSKSDWAGRW
ncbi:MAG: hypothetical protein E6Q97_11085 [Desulfurellales bacterium]|nr:MAG: hypothetical protein E6Q97_11085 [Desulfurellales bacterium]